MMRAVSICKALGATVIFASPCTAFAQDSMGTTEDIAISPSFSLENVAGSRNDSGLSPEPLRVGPFNIGASLAVAAGYDTNVLRRSVKQGDAFVAVIPRLQATLDTGKYQFRLGGSANLRRFADLASENSEEFQINSGVGLKLTDGVSLSAGAGFGHLVQERSSFGTVPGAAETISYDQLTGNIGARIELGNLRIGPSLRFSEQDFSPVDLLAGGTADVSFRDLRSIGGNLRVGYKISEPIEVFADANIDDDDSLSPAAGRSRDSRSYSVLGGVRGEFSRLLVGEIALGYRKRNYENAFYNDSDGLTFRANLEWFPTELISFRLSASQAVQNSGVLQSAGVVASRAALEVYYDPTRQVRIAATIGYTHRDFRDTGTDTNSPMMRMQAQYRVNQHVALGSYAQLTRQTVSGPTIVDPNTTFNFGLGIVLTP